MPLERANLTDRQRVAVVLQAAALLAHLERGRRCLTDGWAEIRVDRDATLRLAGVTDGRPSPRPQLDLIDLVARLFGRQDVPGRGVARRAARRLVERWRQPLIRLSADMLVADVLEAAPFLWMPAFANVRRALAARLGRQLWVAGPGVHRARMLRGVGSLDALEARLAQADAQAIWSAWRDDEHEDPEALATAGRWRRAVSLWAHRPPTRARAVLSHAEALFALGRYERAIEALRGARGWESRLLRVRCRVLLGELRAAEAAMIRLARSALPDRGVVCLAEEAVRVLANRGRRGAVGDWVARALAVSRGPWHLRAEIVAAWAAYDRGHPDAMSRHLDNAVSAQDVTELAWRWHHARGMLCLLRRDGPGAVAHLTSALRVRRRHLARARAAGLWNDLVLARTMIDDLAGAERACRHAVRLFSRCDGPRTTTLAQPNFAEIRMRRGRLGGVAELLERSVAANRRSDNLRGWLLDLVLWARFELAHGRPAAALAHGDEARRLSEGQPLDPMFRVLAARAFGWLGRPSDARAALGDEVPDEVGDLEPEERPALLALAGRMEDALASAHGTRWQALWHALARGDVPPTSTWSELDSLEPYRAARLIFDCERLRPGVVPPHRVRDAIVTLRRAGASALADNLERHTAGVWPAIEGFLERSGTPDAEAVRSLLESAGYRELRLSWQTPGEAPRTLIHGPEGPKSIEDDFGLGRLRLEGDAIDATLRALFRVIGRAFERGGIRPAPTAVRPTTSEMLGSSPVLRAAIDRLTQLGRATMPVLILGESGTGKELAAGLTHRASSRSTGPFLAVNCAALAGENLVLSDLFGHVRGAFTGADRDRAGVFESARGGTVFLDEIGDLPPAAQGLLLRVLQESEIRRLGESHSRPVDVRVVAATHRPLEQMVEEERFRKDLFFRLKVATVRLPPLRDRGDDVLLLARAHLRSIGGVPEISRQVAQRLQAHDWPGNVRELHNVLDVANALAVGDRIDIDHLEIGEPSAEQNERGTYHERIEHLRRALILEALEESGGNQAAAARNLGLSRQALSYLIRSLGLTVEPPRRPGRLR